VVAETDMVIRGSASISIRDRVDFPAPDGEDSTISNPRRPRPASSSEEASIRALAMQFGASSRSGCCAAQISLEIVPRTIYIALQQED
jgi:hypothetical protein